MKCFLNLVLLFTIILFLETKCMVTEKTSLKKLNVTTETLQDVTETPKKNATKSVNDGVNSVYIEDVLYSLVHQNWTDEEMPCLNQTLRLLRSLQNFTLWAVWQWDSVSSQPEGILYGNRYEIGNFDECMDRPWADHHEDLKTQYCLVDIDLERTDNARKKTFETVQPYMSALDFMQQRLPNRRPLSELTWGACVPAVCGPRSVQRLMRTVLARSHLGMTGMKPRIRVDEPCQKPDEPIQFDGLFYAFVVTMCSLAGVVLYCTYMNKDKVNLEPENLKEAVIKSFCLQSNGLSLLDMKKEGLDVLYGIRFLNICLIVVDHQIGILNAGPVSDGKYVDETAMSPLGMFILHDDLFVDTYFMMSSFLTAVTISKFKSLPNPIILLLKRYVRLVVAFAVVVFFMCAVYPYTGSGPLWNRTFAMETDPCRKNWWLALLMLNNYINTEDNCIVVSWYIPCDFHFYVITVFGIYLYRKSPSIGIICTVAISFIAVVLPGIITYTNNLEAIQLFTYEFVRNPRAHVQFHQMYIKSHTRFGAYLVGFFAGKIFVSYSANGQIRRISQRWSIVGTIAGLFIMTGVMTLGQRYLLYAYHPLEGAVYAAVNRPIWTIGLAIFVLSCSLGKVPLINGFLSWYAWVPLSRLAYGVYLTHTIIISRNAMVVRNPQHNDSLALLTSSLGVIVIGCVCALIIWLVTEAPANNLLQVLLMPRTKRTKQSEHEQNESASSDIAGTSNSGYLHSNLPSTVQLSSKI